MNDNFSKNQSQSFHFTLSMEYIQPILDQDTIPQIFPYFDANQVSEEYRNEIIVAQIYKLKENSQKFDKSDAILLRQFAVKIINDELRQQQEQLIGTTKKYLPLKDYDLKKTDYMNLRLWQIKHKEGYKLENLPADQYVYISYFKDQSEGCQHYIRGCQVKCETCGKFYPCRLCHDDVEDHEFPRYDLKIVKCNKCGQEQPFTDRCNKCGHLFATYKCDICKVLCSLGFNAKPNYHCPKCKVCMVELPSESKHCDKCGNCIKLEFFDQHTCIKAKSDTCPICYGSTVKSIFPVVTLPCGHQIHQHCLIQYEKSYKYSCPVCRKSLFTLDDLKEYYSNIDKFYDKYLLNEYQQRFFVNILCNQCNYKFQTHLYPANLYKCPKCNYYNTTVTETTESKVDNLPFEERNYRKQQNIDDILYVLQTYFNNKEKSLTGQQIVDMLKINLKIDYWFPALINKCLDQNLDKLQKNVQIYKQNKQLQFYIFMEQFPWINQNNNQQEIPEEQNEEHLMQQLGEELEEQIEESDNSTEKQTGDDYSEDNRIFDI